MEPIYQQLNALFENPQFAKEFEANPKEAYEKHSGEKWPYRQANVKVVTDDASTLHVTFPPPPGMLYDDELSDLSGGIQLSDAASAASASTYSTFIGCLGCLGTASSNSAQRVAQAAAQIMHGDSAVTPPADGQASRPPTE